MLYADVKKTSISPLDKHKSGSQNFIIADHFLGSIDVLVFRDDGKRLVMCCGSEMWLLDVDQFGKTFIECNVRLTHHHLE